MSLLRRNLKIAGLTLVGVTALLWGMDRFSNKLPEELRGADDIEQTAIDTIPQNIIKDIAASFSNRPGPVTRDAHAKSHGCVKATFQVADNVADNLKVGIFANEGAVHKAWVRFSNGSFRPSQDIDFNGRGLSLKILDVPSIDPADPSQKDNEFDILLVNHSEFFSPNPVDYLDFVKAGVLFGKPGALEKYFMPNYNPFSWRIRQFFIAYANSSQEIKTPLDKQYFSMSPYAFGPDQQIKYTAKACSSNRLSFDAQIDKDNPNYLRTNLKQHLDKASACFTLGVQVNDGSVSIEDASAKWSEAASPFQDIGMITIPKQDFATPHNDNFCEHSDFNPGRTPKDFEALGGINRLRQAVYSSISKYRHTENAIPVADPNIAWDQE